MTLPARRRCRAPVLQGLVRSPCMSMLHVSRGIMWFAQHLNCFMANKPSLALRRKTRCLTVP